MTIEDRLHQQVECARAAFFKLACHRAADLVLHQGKSWNEASAYINAEMAGLDQQLDQFAPQPPAAANDEPLELTDVVQPAELSAEDGA